MFKIEHFTKAAIAVCEDADRNRFKTNCLADCSALMAKEKQLAPATIAVVDNVLQISCPANGCYCLKLKVVACFKPGRNYCWSFDCWARSLVEAQKYETQVSYKLDDGPGKTQNGLPGLSITKNVPLAERDYKTYTFIISVPPGADAAGNRILDLEITNPNLKDTGGIIRISRMELKQEINEHEVYDLWPSGLPPGQKELLPNQEYIEGNWYRDVSRPSLIVYKPALQIKQPVGVILCPGGSYGLLDSMENDAVWLNSLGITAFQLKYRVPAYPRLMAFQDVQRAMRLVRSKAAELNIAKLGIMGASAGCHLALMAATNLERRIYDAIDAVDILDCRPDFAISLCMPFAVNMDGTRSDDIRIDDKTPPIFFAHGDEDTAASPINSATVYIELRKRKIPSELHIWSKEGHSIERNKFLGLCEKWMQTMGIISR